MAGAQRGVTLVISNPFRSGSIKFKKNLTFRGTETESRDMKKSLEQTILKLPTLSHVGMALVQFVFDLRRTTDVTKDAFGVFDLGYVSLGFPAGEEKIQMYVNLDINAVDAMDMRWLPLKQEGEGFPMCEITTAGQLGQTVRYIELAKKKYMTTRQIPSYRDSQN